MYGESGVCPIGGTDVVVAGGVGVEVVWVAAAVGTEVATGGGGRVVVAGGCVEVGGIFLLKT